MNSTMSETWIIFMKNLQPWKKLYFFLFRIEYRSHMCYVKCYWHYKNVLNIQLNILLCLFETTLKQQPVLSTGGALLKMLDFSSCKPLFHNYSVIFISIPVFLNYEGVLFLHILKMCFIFLKILKAKKCALFSIKFIFLNENITVKI